MRLVCFALALVAALPSSAQIHAGLDGTALVDALVADYKPYTVLSLAASKDTLYAVVDSSHVGGQVGAAGIYTGQFVPFDCAPNCDPSQDVFNGGSGLSQEHIWPRSQGGYCPSGSPATCDDRAESDLHHLRAALQTVNSARGNLPFGESDDGQTTAWYRHGTVRSSVPASEIEAWSERLGSALFEPRESEKGDVARAMFYVYTMYGPRTSGQADEAFFASMRETLLAWHAADPADNRETARMWRAAAYQEDKPNPFVLDATLAARAYGSAAPSDPPTASGYVPVAWINEVHYDNAGADEGEFIEVAVDSSFAALERLLVTFYNGSNGTAYDAHAVSLFTRGDAAGTARLYHLAVAGIQNGSPDGIALSFSDGGALGDSLLAFLCYEGTFTAASGPADGATCTDIGVAESGSTPAGTSLQRTGTGRVGTDFAWSAGEVATPGTLNVGQTMGLSQNAVTLDGPEGWHLLAAPSPVRLSSFLSTLWTQGAAGADTEAGAPNVYRYDAASGWVAVTDLERDLRPGDAVAVYVYADDDPLGPGLQGGFPKSLPVVGYEAGVPFAYALLPRGGTVDGFHLLGNPTNTAVAWGAWAASDVGATVHVYDPALPGYRSHNGTAGSLANGEIPAYTGYWVETTGEAPGLTALRPAPPARRAPPAVLSLHAEAVAEGQALRAVATLVDDDAAAASRDRLDGRWRAPLDATHVRLYTLTPDGEALSLDARPLAPGDTVRLGVGIVQNGAPVAGTVRVSWDGDAFPPFSVVAADGSATGAANASGFDVTLDSSSTGRLTLVVGAATDAAAGPEVAPLGLSVGPNPARDRIRVVATRDGARLGVEVYDALGRRVMQLPERAHRWVEDVDVRSLAPGAYAIRVHATEADGTRTQTTRRIVVVR
ncbi:MAG: endonuclease [Bacteroidota bacterium]